MSDFITDFMNPKNAYSGPPGPFQPYESTASQNQQIAFARQLLHGHQSRIKAIEDTLMNLPSPFSAKARKGYSDWFANRQLMDLDRRQEMAARNGMAFDMQQQGSETLLNQRKFDATLAEQARAQRLPSLLEKAGVAADVGSTIVQQAGTTAQITASAPSSNANPSTMEQVLGALSSLIGAGSKTASAFSSGQNNGGFSLTR